MFRCAPLDLKFKLKFINFSSKWKFNTGWIRLSCIPLKLVCCWPSYGSGHRGLKPSYEGANSGKTNHLWSLPGSSLEGLETYQAIHVQPKVSFMLGLYSYSRGENRFISSPAFNFLLPAGRSCMQEVVFWQWCIWRLDTEIVPARYDSGDSKAKDLVLECK